MQDCSALLTCQRQLLDEVVHARLAILINKHDEQHGGVAQHDDGEEYPQHSKLFRLQERER